MRFERTSTELEVGAVSSKVRILMHAGQEAGNRDPSRASYTNSPTPAFALGVHIVLLRHWQGYRLYSL